MPNFLLLLYLLLDNRYKHRISQESPDYLTTYTFSQFILQYYIINYINHCQLLQFYSIWNIIFHC